MRFNAILGVLAVHGMERFTRGGAFEGSWVLKVGLRTYEAWRLVLLSSRST